MAKKLVKSNDPTHIRRAYVLKSARLDTGFSQQKIADLLYLSRETIVAVENCRLPAIESFKSDVEDRWFEVCRESMSPATLEMALQYTTDRLKLVLNQNVYSDSEIHKQRASLLFRIRVEAGIEQHEMAKRLNLTVNIINGIENCYRSDISSLTVDAMNKWWQICSDKVSLETTDHFRAHLLSCFEL